VSHTSVAEISAVRGATKTNLEVGARVGVKMFDYFSSALVEVLAKADFGVWSPIESLSAQGIHTGPARSSPFVFEVPFARQGS